MHLSLPTHPTKRHPRTGAPLEALWVRPDGRVMWPILGASPDDPADGSGGGDGGPGGDPAGGTGGGSGGGSGGGGQQTRTNATDGQGNDLGFPKDTPIAEMSDKEQAAYWRYNSRKHEGRFKDLVGDRKPEDVKADLDAYAQVRQQQMTPAEQALAAAREEGKAEAITAERRNAATTIFRAALETGGIEGDDLDELVTSLNVDAYLTDSGVDTTKLTNFAKRFHPSGKDDKQDRRRDFGGGKRKEGQETRGSAGKAEAQRRFGKPTSGE
ncbi:hypothetical protein QWY28_17325 [Nocardioides sp. SOB77]|uniref:DUF4355 domain-containing protein n=1 Tax=Nocardioides oceani TaxID=3058369 RepID=A0ABT8FJ75_9ACTN|nr:hypothetical protein [Nocardioides oceani]MDN4174726.1 hypothetical protein [Nocardioides oceani]